MFEYTKEDLNELAHSLNFVRDTLEKSSSPCENS